MTERERSGVGGVEWMGRLAQGEERLDHLLHLHLVSTTPTGHGGLDLVGRVLRHLTTGAHGLDHGDATGLTHRHRRAYIHLEQHSFHSHDGDGVLGEQGTKFRLEFGEAMMDLVGRGCAQDPEGQGARRRVVPGIEHAVAAAGQTRIDPQYEHAYDPTRYGRVDHASETGHGPAGDRSRH